MDMIRPEFTEEYYRPEVRENFRIAEMTKRYWAAQLMVLAEVDRVCRTNDIRWFADFGTLIGAVRHRGFIPWDDDIDIAMLRSDYEHFLQAAVTDLPKKYRVFDVLLGEGYGDQFGRVINCDRIEYGKEHLAEFCGCPYTVGIDIYPLDALYDDEEEEQERCDRAAMVRKALSLADTGRSASREFKMLITRIEVANNVKLPRKSGIKHALEVMLRDIYSECLCGTTEYVAYMSGWERAGRYRYKKEWFAHREYMPFENISVPVPCGYDNVLRNDYGDYAKVHRSAGMAHSYPIYRDQQEKLIKRLKDEHEDALLAYIVKTADKHLEHGDKCTEIMDMCDQVMDTIDNQMSDNIISCRMLLQGMTELCDSLSLMITADYGEKVSVLDKIDRLKSILPQNAVKDIPSVIDHNTLILQVREHIGSIRKDIDELYRGHGEIS